MTDRIRREDAIRVAEALPYDPECDRCLGTGDGEHGKDCALAARDRILSAALNKDDDPDNGIPTKRSI